MKFDIDRVHRSGLYQQVVDAKYLLLRIVLKTRDEEEEIEDNISTYCMLEQGKEAIGANRNKRTKAGYDDGSCIQEDYESTAKRRILSEHLATY